MPTKERAPQAKNTRQSESRRERQSESRRQPRPAAKGSEPLHHEPGPSAAVQRARLAPHLLSPGGVSRLQQVGGNRAVSQIAASIAPRQHAPPPQLTVQASLQRMLAGRGLPPQLEAVPEQREAVPEQRAGQEATSEGPGNQTGIPTPVLEEMEGALGQDFSDVRVHPDSPKAPQAGALAYTQGSALHFAPGQYQPQTTGGQRLLGHELAHVVQQRQGRVKPTMQLKSGVLVNDDRGLEKQADTAADRALGGGTVQRQGDQELKRKATLPIVQKRRTTQDAGPAQVGRGTIQRAVGFEFEDGAWTSFQALDDVEGSSSAREEESSDGSELGEAPPKFEGRTFAYGIIVDDEEGMSDPDARKLFKLIPGLKKLRKWLKQNTHAHSQEELVRNAKLWIGGKKNNVYMGDEKEQNHNFFLFASYIDKMFADLFEVEPEGLDEDEFALDDDDRDEITEAMGELIASTLKAISPKDMTPRELAELQKEFTGTNIFSTLEPEGTHINTTVAEYGLEAAGKKGALHEEAGFAIEADGPYEQGRMDIEFVTSPFEETEAGYKQLKQVLKRIRTITNHTGGYAGRNYAKGEFVQPNETGFSKDDVYLAGGRSKAGFKMQVTQGIPLSDIPALMETLGTNVPGETHKQGKNRASARRMMRGDKAPNKDSDALGQVPQMANAVLKQLAPYMQDAGELDSLRGFLSYMMLYIVQLDFGDPKGIKLRLPLMSRFSFDILFNQLPPEQQVWLSKNALTVADTIGNVLAGHLTDFALERPMINVRGVPSQFRRGGHEGFFDLMKTLTVDQWITGILVAGQDRLVASNMKGFLTQMGTDYEQYDKSISIYLRGHANASNLVGKVDDLAIMENRDINPKGDVDLSMDETEEISLAYMKFLINLKGAKNKDNVAFPKVKKV